MNHQSAIPSCLGSVVRLFLDGLGTPLATRVRTLIDKGEWDQLVALKTDPRQYTSAESYFADTCAISFLRKCKDLPTTIDRKAVAVENFWMAEKQCMATNLRLQRFEHSTPADRSFWERYDEGSFACYDLIDRARKKIFETLGRAPSHLDGRFGPGATFADKGQLATVPDKMTSRPTMTSSFWPFMFSWAGTAWSRNCAEDGRHPYVVRGNRFTTVPKDATKDRGIAVEPSLNLFFQLGLGRVLKRKLRSAGINLQDGKEIHARVAREASVTGAFSTLDLSNASDTVSYNLVKLLLPSDWFDIVDSLRSPFTLIEGRWVKLEKFSSMGNGFTFELETLIFASICQAVQDMRTAQNPDNLSASWGDGIWTYGDDIIVPTHISDDVIGALRFLGFSLNESKSFQDGWFRESCGGDFFNGVAVRPFFLKEFPHEPQHWITIANGIRALAFNDHCPNDRFVRFRRAWFKSLDQLPTSVRGIRGPTSLGDLVVHDEPERFATRRRGELLFNKVYKPASFREISWKHWHHHIKLAAILYSPSGFTDRGVIPRDGVLGYRVGWVPTPEATSKWLPPGCKPD